LRERGKIDDARERLMAAIVGARSRCSIVGAGAREKRAATSRGRAGSRRRIDVSSGRHKVFLEESERRIRR
jgi:hypothetical protein